MSLAVARLRRARLPFLALVFPMAIAACDGDGPGPPGQNSIRISASTTGSAIDSDGYAASVDGGQGQTIPANGGSAMFTNLTAGDHSVQLSGVAFNCTVSSPNPRTVAVSAGTTATTTFDVACVGALNNQIVFESNRDYPAGGLGPGNFEVYGMNADGTAVTRLSNNLADDLFTAVSPDGTKIAFSSNRTGDHDIWVMNINGSNPVNLTSNPAGDDWYASWSPDGSKIAFMSNRTGNFEIFVVNADGTNPVNITNNAAEDGDPAWSPDGSKIAFYTNRDGNVEVYVMNTDGRGLVNLTNNAAQDASPAWSPDGLKIAFGTNRDGNFDIYTMNPDGTSLVRVTMNAAVDAFPSWSPDGLRIAFHTARDGNPDIYVINADGTGAKALTQNAASDLLPSWSR